MRTNEYTDQLPAGLFDAIPKSVFAAIAISALTSGGDRLSDAGSEIVTEWHMLANAEIVPQAVPARWRDLVWRTDV